MDSDLLYLHVLVSCQAAAAAERKRSLRRCMVSCTWLASDLPNLMNLPMQPHSFPYFPCLVIIKVVVPMGAAPFHRKDPGPAVAGKRRLHIKELLHCSAATPYCHCHPQAHSQVWFGAKLITMLQAKWFVYVKTLQLQNSSSLHNSKA